MEVNCERFSAKIDKATCLARQQSPTLGQGCKGCEEGARIMEEHQKQPTEGFVVETYPCGKPKITGTCKICGKWKILISQKNPICAHCRKLQSKKRSPDRNKRKSKRPAGKGIDRLKGENVTVVADGDFYVEAEATIRVRFKAENKNDAEQTAKVLMNRGIERLSPSRMPECTALALKLTEIVMVMGKHNA